MNKNLKIIIVDDNETFRKGLKFYIENIMLYEIIEEFANGEDFINSDNHSSADIILLDIDMPKVDGIKAAKEVLWRYNELKIMAITNYYEKAYLTELMGAGFKGCVFKQNIYDELGKAIDDVINNKMFFPEDIKV